MRLIESSGEALIVEPSSKCKLLLALVARLKPSLIFSDTDNGTGEIQDTTTSVHEQITGIQHNGAAKKANQTFLQEFMQDISVILHIPIQLLRPYDQLAADLSIAEDKLKQILETLDVKYALGASLSQHTNMPFITLEDIANAIAEIRSRNSTANNIIESIRRGHFSNNELSSMLNAISDHIRTL